MLGDGAVSNAARSRLQTLSVNVPHNFVQAMKKAYQPLERGTLSDKANAYEVIREILNTHIKQNFVRRWTVRLFCELNTRRNELLSANMPAETKMFYWQLQRDWTMSVADDFGGRHSLWPYFISHVKCAITTEYRLTLKQLRSEAGREHAANLKRQRELSAAQQVHAQLERMKGVECDPPTQPA